MAALAFRLAMALDRRRRQLPGRQGGDFEQVHDFDQSMPSGPVRQDIQRFGQAGGKIVVRPLLV
ncbi:MAG TPA: hypothetical protein VIK47_03550 [Kiloniellales bacterium]